MPITTTHKLLTRFWTTDVEALETAVRGFGVDRMQANRCRVAFFEILGDESLHVNVTHTHQTLSVSGWAGPASVPDGFVHNRTFCGMQMRKMIQQIRQMVFAGRAWSGEAAGARA